MNEINIYWCKWHKGKQNFGDEVGPFLVNKLSGKSIAYIPVVNKPWKAPLVFLIGVYYGIYRMKEFKGVFKGILEKKTLLTVGSILNYYGGGYPTVWGAGIISRTKKVQEANFLAVRGKHTQERLKELGYKAPDVLGDPALLLPLVIKKPKVVKKYRLGVIPHYFHYEEVKERFKSDEVLVINVFDDIEKVVDDITSCEKTISSSLHGIIVSHAYDIACLWYDLSSQTKLVGDDIKFDDYFSSVGISSYKPFKQSNKDNIDVDSIMQTIDANNDKNRINVSLVELQKRLLSVAPFPLKEDYKVLLKVEK